MYNFVCLTLMEHFHYIFVFYSSRKENYELCKLVKIHPTKEPSDYGTGQNWFSKFHYWREYQIVLFVEKKKKKKIETFWIVQLPERDQFDKSEILIWKFSRQILLIKRNALYFSKNLAFVRTQKKRKEKERCSYFWRIQRQLRDTLQRTQWRIGLVGPQVSRAAH